MEWNGGESENPGVIAGVIVWFIEHDITAFVPIQEPKENSG